MGQILAIIETLNYDSINSHDGVYEAPNYFNQSVFKTLAKFGVEETSPRKNHYLIHEFEHYTLNNGFDLVNGNPVGISQLEGCFDEIYSWTMRKGSRFNQKANRKYVAETMSALHGFRFFDFNSFEEMKKENLSIADGLKLMRTSKMSSKFKQKILKNVMYYLDKFFANSKFNLSDSLNQMTIFRIVEITINTTFKMVNQYVNYMSDEQELLWRRFNLNLKLELIKAKRVQVNTNKISYNNICQAA